MNRPKPARQTRLESCLRKINASIYFLSYESCSQMKRTEHCQLLVWWKSVLKVLYFPEGPRRKFSITVPAGKFGRRYSTMHSVSTLLFLVFSDTCLDQSLDNPKESIKAIVHLNPLVHRQIWVSLRRNLHAVMQAVYWEKAQFGGKKQDLGSQKQLISSCFSVP